MQQANLFGAPPSPTKHFLQFKDFSSAEIAYLFERTRWIKEKFKRYEFYQPLRDRTLAMVFEKASTRTRVSFEAGMYQLGGSVIHLTTGDTQLGRAERDRGRDLLRANRAPYMGRPTDARPRNARLSRPKAEERPDLQCRNAQ